MKAALLVVCALAFCGCGSLVPGPVEVYEVRYITGGAPDTVAADMVFQKNSLFYKDDCVVTSAAYIVRLRDGKVVYDWQEKYVRSRADARRLLGRDR